MPWTSKRKWYAARSATGLFMRWEGQRRTDPAIVWRRHVVTSSPWGFTRQDRLGAFRLRNEIRKLHSVWREARRAAPHAVDVNGHFVPLDKAPIKIETTIGEQKETK